MHADGVVLVKLVVQYNSTAYYIYVQRRSDQYSCSKFQRVTENKSLDQNDDMIIDEPDHSVAGSSTHPIIISDNTAVLPYEDELDLST